MGIENSVFVSYRRTNYYIARSVYQDLRAHDYDVFLDYQNIDSGSFERVILNQIAARAHFIIILTPSALERCVSPGDWVRREIEHAIDTKRNIVPLMFEDFDFGKAQPFLAGKLSALPGYNGIRVPPDFFEEAMERLRTRFLNKSLDVILHPTPVEERAVVAEKIAGIEQQAVPTKAQRSAESLFERGYLLYQEKDYASAITHFNDALALNAEYVDAFYYRGLARHEHGDLPGAITDYSAALDIISPANLRKTGSEPQQRNIFYRWKYEIYYHRARAYHSLDKLSEALADYSEALRLHPPYVSALIGRGNARINQGDYNRAIKDFEEVLRIEPDSLIAREGIAEAREKQKENRPGIFQRLKKQVASAFAATEVAEFAETAKEYYERSMARPREDFAGRLADLNEALRLNPQYAAAFIARGSVHYWSGDFEAAREDNTKAIQLVPRSATAYINRGEAYLALGQPDKALADFQAAEKLKRDSEPMVIGGMALSYYAVGQADKARDLWQQLIKRDKRYKNADFVAQTLRWHPRLVEMAQPFIESL